MKFLNNKGLFRVDNVQDVSYLYFPITNGYLLRGAITPNLNGDLKIDQNHFVLVPTSQEDLQNSLFGRHFWLKINGEIYNISGVSARQKYLNDDQVEVSAGFLYHEVKRVNQKLGIEVNVTTFAPYGQENIELSKVVIKNITNNDIQFTPTVAIPLFSRSADNLRDHRHVTALLNRAKVVKNGIINKPTLSFDERGHIANDTVYGVFISDDVKYYNPKLQDFIGEGGSLDWPKSLLADRIGCYQVGDEVDGFEVIGAMQLGTKILKPNEAYECVFGIAVSNKEFDLESIYNNYCNLDKFNELLAESKKIWESKINKFIVKTSDSNFDNWLKWVSLQPILRRIYGCSFLPHHDYGRGGRGWRDLWQDCLALILMDDNEVNNLLYNNFAGVRIDGSNATIIGEKPGEFKADRNNIPRVWMDHGAWPWNTLKLYIDRTGDYEFLFKKQSYFKDANIHFSKAKDIAWNDSLGNKQLDANDNIYEGTILEHILLQNLVQFFNVGAHNNMRLEGADWNDGLDMAKDLGESVAFTAFYLMNFIQIKDTLSYLQSKGIDAITIFAEMERLINDDINYTDYKAKNALLHDYFVSVSHKLSGNVKSLKIEDIIKSLEKKITHLKEHLQNEEWIDINEDQGFYIGYYDNLGRRLEGIVDKEVQMTLTGQVFTIMSGLASLKQIRKVINTAKEYLYDKKVAGYRLNTNFKGLRLDMGRLFGFAYGHKENGAMFSHMAMMFANSLYKRGFVSDAYKILNDIYKHCMDFPKAKIYPGIPEYIDSDGRGMYHYLTGSASWYILNVIDEMFGIKGYYGNLYLLPKLVKNQFNSELSIEITTAFNHKPITVKYINSNNKEYGEYTIEKVFENEKEIDFIPKDNGAIIERNLLDKIEDEIKLTVILK